MKADYVHKDTLTATDYVELNKNNELLMSYNQELLKENQQLKEEVKAVNKGLRKVQQRSIQYKNRCFELNKKIYELEEQLEDITLCRDIASGHRKEVQDRETILLNQQKEFIKWLEDKIQQQETVIAENQEKLYFLIYEDEKEDLKSSSQKAYIRRIILIEILQKYKEIIGGK